MALNVYYLDDEEVLCEQFSLAFNSENVKVRTFTNAEEAIDVITANPPDVFFIDFHLDRTDANRVAAVIAPQIPKILVTGDLATFPTAHFKKVLYKPISVDKVNGQLAEILDHKSGAKEDIEMRSLLLSEGVGKALLKEEFDQIIEQLEDVSIVAVTNKRGEITYANRAFCRLSGYSIDELLGKNIASQSRVSTPMNFFATYGRPLALVKSGKVQ